MYLMRLAFRAKYGRVGELLDLTKKIEQLFRKEGWPPSRILTDASGLFDTVVVETETESIDQMIQMSRTPPSNPEFGALMQRSLEITDSGSREFYNIES